ncbi:MAG: YraN family protein [Woeseiaceae bacterium]|nr:YraN family protein [Woeseiaceae bacterium]
MQESAALAWLEQRGLRLMARNVRCRLGEIDLVLEDGDNLVFVEVRYRREGNRLSAVQSVGSTKQRRIIAAASWYLSRNARHAGRPVRFDVVAMSGKTSGRAALKWYPDAFRPGS